MAYMAAIRGDVSFLHQNYNVVADIICVVVVVVGVIMIDDWAY